jgi:hypothetical protein
VTAARPKYTAAREDAIRPDREPLRSIEDLLTADEREQLRADLRAIARLRRKGEDECRNLPMA